MKRLVSGILLSILMFSVLGLAFSAKQNCLSSVAALQSDSNMLSMNSLANGSVGLGLAGSMWVSPSVVSVSGVVGSMFNVTVWANISQPSFTWQVSLTFDSNYFVVEKAGYTGGGTSLFYSGHSTVPIAPVIGSGSVVCAESLLGSDSRAAGSGSLCWVEFEVKAVSSQFQVLSISNGDTYFLDTSLNEIPLTRSGASVVSEQPTYAVIFNETGLPPGIEWWIDLNGVNQSSASSVITFFEPNGTYPFTVVSLVGNEASQSFGTVMVIGGDVSQHITFTGTVQIISVQPQNPPGNVQPNQAVTIQVNVTDIESSVESVRIIYNTTTSALTLDFPMTFNLTSGLWEYTIPGQQTDTLVQYKITAYDYAGNNKTDDNAGQYYVYAEVPEFPPLIILLLFIVTTLLTAMVYRRKHSRKLIHKYTARVQTWPLT